MRKKMSGKATDLVLVLGLAVAVGWPLTGLAQAIHPYVLVEFSQSENGAPEPMVVSPSGNTIVDASGKILDSRAGTLGAFTETSGIQEGINFAIATGSDLYIEGRNAVGRTNNNVYFVNAPIVIPAAQDFRIDGGAYVINYNPGSGDLLTIDSCEDCHYRFGILVTGSVNGYAVRFEPMHPTPIDQLRIITDSSFTFSSIAPNHPPGTSAAGLFFDASNGPILFNDIYATAVIGYQDNVLLESSSQTNAVQTNRIRIFHNHAATQAEIKVSQYSDSNDFWIEDDPNGQAGVSIDDTGSYNTFVLQSSGFPQGADLILEPGAKGNIIIAADPISITDNSGQKNKLIQGTSARELLAPGAKPQ